MYVLDTSLKYCLTGSLSTCVDHYSIVQKNEIFKKYLKHEIPNSDYENLLTVRPDSTEALNSSKISCY